MVIDSLLRHPKASEVRSHRKVELQMAQDELDGLNCAALEISATNVEANVVKNIGRFGKPAQLIDVV